MTDAKAGFISAFLMKMITLFLAGRILFTQVTADVANIQNACWFNSTLGQGVKQIGS